MLYIDEHATHIVIVPDIVEDWAKDRTLTFAVLAPFETAKLDIAKYSHQLPINWTLFIAIR